VFNISVASKYLSYLREKTNNDASALVAYNIGLTGARRLVDAHDQFRYVKNVYRYFENVVIPFNKKYLKDLDDGVTAVPI
jgi:soluble lytic murein transglycosylase-like protein